MKIVITEIEAAAEDLKASNSLAGAVSSFLRDLLSRNLGDGDADEEDERDEE